MTKIFLSGLFLTALIFSISQSHAATLNCREYGDRYDKLSFTKGASNSAEITIFKYNIKYIVALTGKVGSYDVYESSINSTTNQGKFVFFINNSNGLAAYTLLEVGFHNRVSDSGDNNLICK